MQLQQHFCYYSTNTAPLPEPTALTLVDFHAIIKAGTLTDEHDVKEQVVLYRRITDKSIKNSLPIAYLAGTFGLNHATDTLVGFTGYFTLDFDHLTPAQTAYLADVLSRREYVHLLFRSPSFDALKVIVRAEVVANEDTYKRLYYAFYQHVAKDVLKSIADKRNDELTTAFADGMPEIDLNAGKLGQGCYFSYDENAFLNEEPRTFAVEDVEQFLAHYPMPTTAPAPSSSNKPKAYVQTSDDKAVLILQAIIKELRSSGKSITVGYGNWLAVACAIKAAMGAKGFQYFDELSRLDKDYNAKEVKRLYDNLKDKELQHTLGTVIYYAIGQGVKLPADLLKETFNDIAYIQNYLRAQYRFRTNAITSNVEIAKHGQVHSWSPITDSDYNYWYVQLKQKRISYTDVNAKGEEVAKSRTLFVTNQDIVSVVNNTVFSPLVNPLIERFQSLHAHYFVNASNVPVNDLTEVEKWIKAFTYSGNSERDYWLNWFGGVVQNLTAKYYDRVLVLTGKTGVGKTHAITECLTAPFEGYISTDFTWNTANTDDIRRIASNLFVFDDELKTSRKSDVETIKAVTSKSTIDFRAPYARVSKSVKRIASFLAASNESEILSDLTGNRRFLVLNVTAGNRKLVNEIRYEKLWAEVWNYFYVNKNTHELTDSVIEVNNQSHRFKTIEEEYMREIFDFERVGNIKVGRADNADIALKTIDLIEYINRNARACLTIDNGTKSKVTKILAHYGLTLQRDARWRGVKGDYWFLKVRKQAASSDGNDEDDSFFTDTVGCSSTVKASKSQTNAHEANKFIKLSGAFSAT